jgi:hypothetical protein
MHVLDSLIFMQVVNLLVVVSKNNIVLITLLKNWYISKYTFSCRYCQYFKIFVCCALRKRLPESVIWCC